MRVFTMESDRVSETEALPVELPGTGFLWVAFSRREFELLQGQVQKALFDWLGVHLHELHVQDLLNNQLPSHYDYTADYDLLVFRRLARGRTETDLAKPGEILHQKNMQAGPGILRRIDTSPVEGVQSFV